MARKRPPIPNHLFEHVEILDIADEGKSVARHEGKVIFVKGGVPGDVATIKITKNKGKYFEGEIASVETPSPFRIAPACAHFGVCGGCKWQHFSYEAQLQFKEKQVRECLSRLGGIEIEDFRPIIGCTDSFYYRNKLEFTFSNKRWLSDAEVKSGEEVERNALGFHIPGRFDRVVNVQHCHLQGGASNDIRNAVRKFALDNEYTFYNVNAKVGFMRNVMVRTSTKGLMVIIVFGENEMDKIEPLLQFLKVNFPQITSLNYIINLKVNDTIADQEVNCYHGEPYLIEEMDGLNFQIAPKSFFQTNTAQAIRLYQETLSLAGLKGNEIVYDLYTGTGTIANFLARKAKKVVGIEYVADAIKDAKVNSQINNITNTSFYAGDMKNILTSEFVYKEGNPDVIVTDPPRGGMEKEVVEMLLRVVPAKIVYVSCNPATQARDIAMLSEKYEVRVVQPVDMFPHTHHVESIALLVKK